MKQQAALPPGSPRDKGRPRAVWNVFKQFGSAVVGLLIIAYIGLQLALNVGDFVEVENAMQAYAEAQTDVTAYIFRDEEPVYASAGGACAYLAADGEKVARGQDVAAVYSQAGDASTQERIRELNEKIELLEQSQGFTSAGSTELTRLDASISDGILDVIRSLEAGDPAAALRGDTELLVLMNRRRSLYLPAGSFEAQIERYEEEIRSLEAYYGLAPQILTADEAVAALIDAQGDLTVVDLDIDFDDGRTPRYDGKAEIDGRTYEFEMNAATGDVYEWERD